MDTLKLSLSEQNKAILFEYADVQWQSLQPKYETPKSLTEGISRLWASALSYIGMPSGETVATGISVAFALAHGTTIGDEITKFMGKTLFGASAEAQDESAAVVTASPTTNTTDVAVSVLEGMARSTLGAQAVPLLETLGLSMTGLTMPAIVGVVALVAGRVLLRGGAKALRDVPNLSQLVRQDPLTGNIVDAAGSVLTDRDLADIRESVYRYDFACRLLGSDKHRVTDTVMRYVHMTEDYKLAFADGTVIEQGSKEMLRLQKAVTRLSGTNPTSRYKGIHKTINMIARHMPAATRRPPTIELVEDHGVVAVTDRRALHEEFVLIEDYRV